MIYRLLLGFALGGILGCLLGFVGTVLGRDLPNMGLILGLLLGGLSFGLATGIRKGTYRDKYDILKMILIYSGSVFITVVAITSEQILVSGSLGAIWIPLVIITWEYDFSIKSEKKGIT